ncbi:Protein CBG10798 [Caenorhabditis briggsae]|uniref:Protein CBG10798 n=2 Tax=Caenorhabditis briggsae TaxID=6238 RepID=A8XBT8_CAEBR|nr:Protein CBG10798 [Caenorhabditis briggsae]ULU11324.1 hypothetical protein L3Y34_015059 [Caenorhabditis briggsae]CAP30104.2 Protein CBG10798 [Caenorhabditis briggsae]
MKNLYRNLAISGTLFFCAVLLFSFDDATKWKSRFSFFTRCQHLLDERSPETEILLIDVDFLQKLTEANGTTCLWNERKPIKVGVDMKHKLNPHNLEDLGFEVFYYYNNASKDFLDFEMNAGRRLIPRKFKTRWIGNIEIPEDTQRFAEFWKRSSFRDCVGLDMKRSESDSVFLKGPETADILARLRDDLLDNGMFPFLNGGTFLGWYRECTIIPHTYDADFAVFKYNYKPEYPYKLLNGSSEFKLVRMLGKLEDGLELTVVPKLKANPRIDIFVMYDGIENGVLTHHYTPGLGGDGTKYKFTYPIYDPWCAAELHNHLFWVSCSPKPQIIHEYGPQWYLDHPTSQFAWNSSPKNIRENGKLTKEEMKKYYLEF